MKYYEYLPLIYATCIEDRDDAWTSFVKPEWKHLLIESHLDPAFVEDDFLNYEDVKNILELEAERRRLLTNGASNLTSFIWNLIQAEQQKEKDEVIDPLVKKFVEETFTGKQKDNTSKKISYSKKK